MSYHSAKTLPPTALYASNVSHVGSVLAGLTQAGYMTTLVGRAGLPSRAGELLNSTAMGRLVLPLATRVPTQEIDRSGVQYKSLGAMDLVHPIFARAGVKLPPTISRFAMRQMAKRVAKEKPIDLFMFVEGLGSRLLRSSGGEYRFSICERRNFHHEVFEQDIECFLGFPFKRVKNRLRDTLDFEYERSDRIVVYSSVARESFISRGFSSDRIQVLPLASTIPKEVDYSIVRKNRSVIYVGRGDAFKGLDLAVAATKLTAPRTRLVVAGAAPQDVREWLLKFDHVDYVGILDPESIDRLYRTSSLLLSPSIESYGLAVLEASMRGVRVLCRETTGVAEFLDTSQCEVVSGRDPEVWADRIEAVLGQEGTDQDQYIRRKGTLEARKLSHSNVVELYTKFFSALSLT